MGDIQVRGVDDFLTLSKALKNAGESDLRKELHKGLRDGAKPLIPEMRKTIQAGYGKRGGLAAREAKAPARVAIKTGRDPSISIVFSGLTLKLGEVYGMFRHPVFARPGRTRRQWTWRSQAVPLQDGLFRTAEDNVDKIVPALNDAIDRVARKVVARG